MKIGVFPEYLGDVATEALLQNITNENPAVSSIDWLRESVPEGFSVRAEFERPYAETEADKNELLEDLRARIQANDPPYVATKARKTSPHCARSETLGKIKIKKGEAMPSFKYEEVAGDHPRFTCEENGVEITVYFGHPPGKPRGVWIGFRATDAAIAHGFLARELEQYDRAVLEDVSRQIIVS